MKTAFVFVLLAIIVAVFADQHCIENDFTAQVILVEPSKDYDDQHTIYFSTDSQKQRIDINEFDPEVKTISVYQRYDLGKMYFYDKQTQKCDVHPLTGSLKPFCLAQNATHDGQITLGGQLKADVWRENVFGFELRVILSSYQGIPVNIFSKGGARHGVILQEWYNYQHGVADQKVFDLPSACNQAQAPRLMTATKTSEIPSQKIIEKVNKLMVGVRAAQL